MTAPILLTGGTGTLGRLVLPLLRQKGYDVRVLSRRPHPSAEGVEQVVGDLSSGEGVAAAVAGVETIIHCAGTARGDDVKARHLVDAATGAGRPHLVFISVVGAERIPVTGRVDRAAFGYFASKRAAEQVVFGSGLPWTTLRATQFHDLFLMTVRGLAKLPVVPVFSGFRFQPVDTGDVAARLVELSLGSPAGMVAELGGPTIYTFAELVSSYLAATHRRRPLVPVRVPGDAARAIRGGANLTPLNALGTRTWEDFLAQHLADAARGRGQSAGR